jgi:hypothetical protein
MTIPKDPNIRAVAGAVVIGFWGLFGYVVLARPKLRNGGRRESVSSVGTFQTETLPYILASAPEPRTNQKLFIFGTFIASRTFFRCFYHA